MNVIRCSTIPARTGTMRSRRAIARSPGCGSRRRSALATNAHTINTPMRNIDDRLCRGDSVAAMHTASGPHARRPTGSEAVLIRCIARARGS